MSIEQSETRAPDVSNGALTRAQAGIRPCGTRRRRAGALLTRLAGLGHWYRRDFTYAFGRGLVGDTPDPPGPNQTLSNAQAQDAVRAAFTQWSTATNMAGQPIQLRFTEVGLNDHPDAIVEWVPPLHDAETRDDVSGQWTFADDLDMTPGADGPTDPGAGAHADFPPESVGGAEGNEFEEPPIPIHFNDDNPTAWHYDLVEAFALHEIGHMLGLEHPDNDDPLPAGVTAVMSKVPLTSINPLRVLQPHDRTSIDELYGAPGPQRFNWIWMKGTHERRALWGLTREELNNEIDNVQEPEGFHVAHVGGYVLPSETLYTAIVERGGTADRHYVTNRTRANFDEVHADYRGKGYRLIDVNAFIDAGNVVRYNGVWAKDLVDSRTFVGIEFIPLVAELNKASHDGYRPVLINGYEKADLEERWNALFVKQGALGEPRDWEAHVNFSREDFDAKYDELGPKFDPTYFHTKVLPEGRGERWTGIWERIGVPSRESYDWVERDFVRVTALREKQIEGLQAWSLNAFVRPPEPATISLASLDQAPTGRRMCVLGMAVDETRVYAARYHTLNEPPHTSERAGVLVILDRQELRPVPGLPQLPGQPRGVPVGFEPRSVAVNPVSGKVYVVNYGLKSYSLTVIDTATFAVLKTIKLGQAPQQIAVNTKLNRVYVSNTFQRCVQVIDGATDTLLEPIVLGPGPTGVAVDEARNTLYVVVANLYEAPFTNGLFAVIDNPQSREILPFVPISPVGIVSQDVVFDSKMDRIYVANQGNIGSGPPSVTVLHRPSRSILATIPLPGPARQIDVSSSAGEIYVTTDRGDVQVINTSSLKVTRAIQTGPAPWAIAAGKDTVRQVYVGDRFDGSIVRLS